MFHEAIRRAELLKMPLPTEELFHKTCAHEAGHALTYALDPLCRLLYATAFPGTYLSNGVQKPVRGLVNAKFLTDGNKFCDYLTISMAGAAGEYLTNGTIDVQGCGQDIDYAVDHSRKHEGKNDFLYEMKLPDNLVETVFSSAAAVKESSPKAVLNAFKQAIGLILYHKSRFDILRSRLALQPDISGNQIYVLLKLKSR